MSKVKRILSVIMAMVMVLAMSVPTFAATTTNNSAVKISGVEAGAKVTAYHIITYDPKGYYKEAIANTITKNADNNLTPTASDVMAIAADPDKLVRLEKYEFTADDLVNDVYQHELGLGTWLIVVTGSSDYIYNPAIVSVQQDTKGVVYGELNLATDTWGTDVYVKRGEPTITKTSLTQNVNGVQIGDKLQYQITADIPDYQANVSDMQYSIKDTLTGLKLVVDGEHSVEATVDNKTDDTLTAAVNAAIRTGETSFEVTGLGDTFLKANAGKQIVLKYWAEVTTSAKLTVDKANNKAELEYSTNGGIGHKESTTEHYTFGIDTTINGSTETTPKTGEFIKIDENGNVSYNETTGQVVVTGEALTGAEFQLHIGSADGALFTNAAGKSTFTTVDGRLEINGLDSDVDYYLVETKAPQGYTVRTDATKVHIDATYVAGKLTGYTVTIGDSKSTTYGVREEEGKITVTPVVQNPFGFKNSKLSSLPSTGGIGTTIFTIGGCAIMIVAAGLFFATRRKTQK